MEEVLDFLKEKQALTGRVSSVQLQTGVSATGYREEQGAQQLMWALSPQFVKIIQLICQRPARQRRPLPNFTGPGLWFNESLRDTEQWRPARLGEDARGLESLALGSLTLPDST